MSNGSKYTPFGNYMLKVANVQKGVRGPYRVAKYMEKEAERRNYDLGVNNKGEPRTLPQGGAASKYFHGKSFPEPWWVMAFRDLFDLDDEQRRELADHYAYKFRVNDVPPVPDPLAA